MGKALQEEVFLGQSFERTPALHGLAGSPLDNEITESLYLSQLPEE